MTNLIFGYTWEEIQAMQSKRYVRPTLPPLIDKTVCSCRAKDCVCGGNCSNPANDSDTSGAMFCSRCN